MEWLYALGLGYLLGSIPFGLILTKLFGVGDIRNIGSGNIGATNVLRTGRKGLAAATLLLDGAKGYLAVWLAGLLWSGSNSPLYFWVWAGFGALLGHCFPVWLRFRGGKGVATMLGASFAFDWRIGLASAATWLLATLISRISSVGGMSSAIATPIAAFALSEAVSSGDNMAARAQGLVLFGVAAFLMPMAMLVVFQHRANIKRLIAGTEPKIGQKG